MNRLKRRSPCFGSFDFPRGTRAVQSSTTRPRSAKGTTDDSNRSRPFDVQKDYRSIARFLSVRSESGRARLSTRRVSSLSTAQHWYHVDSAPLFAIGLTTGLIEARLVTFDFIIIMIQQQRWIENRGVARSRVPLALHFAVAVDPE